jgi:hypothetical protein
MKTLIKIGIALTLITATVQAGRAAVKHYTFVDAIHEQMLFAGGRTEDELAERVLDLAAEHGIPLEAENVTVTRQPFLVEVWAPYTDTVELLPGFYKRRWDFETSVSVRLLEDTRPRGPARR